VSTVTDSEKKALLKFYESLWRARARRSRTVGTIYLVLSMIFLILSYFTRYLVFEVIAIISLLLGVALVFVSLEKYIKLNVSTEALASALLPLNDLIDGLKVQGKAAHVPTGSEAVIFMPNSECQMSEVNYREIKESKSSEKGIVLPSLGIFLKRLYERELGCKAEILDLSALLDWLPKVLVDDLKMAEKMEIARKNDEIRVKLTEPVFSRLCMEKRISRVCETVGCPICSSIADMLAASAGSVVFYKGCEYFSDKNQLTWHYTIGPNLKDKEAKD
jgi:hypothetical protein